MSRTYVVTGSASGMGLATRVLLEAAGHRVVGVDLHDAEVVADLGTPEGREGMQMGVREATGGVVDALIACAGVSGRADRLDESVRVNYFGVVAGAEGLLPLLAAGTDPRVVVVSSIRDLAVPPEYRTLVNTCLAGDEAGACAMAQGFAQHRLVYAASKQAVSRWVRRAGPGRAGPAPGSPSTRSARP
jgi:NAD(P)-dependent dehydrogenase (short-subunit alcohol dehydrogenase family)